MSNRSRRYSGDPALSEHFHISTFELPLTILSLRLRCLDCGNIIQRGHCNALFKCKYCAYKTHCEKAAMFHCQPGAEPENLGRAERGRIRRCTGRQRTSDEPSQVSVNLEQVVDELAELYVQYEFPSLPDSKEKK